MRASQMHGCLLHALTHQKLAVNASGIDCKQVCYSKLRFVPTVLTQLPILTQGNALVQHRRCCLEQPSLGTMNRISQK